jgi:hypothetical protein
MERVIEMEQADNRTDRDDNSETGRKPYSPPHLTLFGQVAALTQNVSCSANTDGAQACTAGALGSMGHSSDRRLKEQIVRVGDHPDGFGLYLYHYKPDYRDVHGHGRQFGVMADEVQAVRPHAVIRREDGFLAVRYDLLGIRRSLH